MEFVTRQFGSSLVISAKGEISYIHHHYYLSNIRITTPSDVTVIREKLKIDGSGRPNLNRPTNDETGGGGNSAVLRDPP